MCNQYPDNLEGVCFVVREHIPLKP